MQSMLKKTLAAVAVGAMAVLGSGMAQASFTFVNGVGTGDITIGDKLFSNFSCLASGVGADCSGVSYDAVPGGAFGIEYNPSATLGLSGPGNRDVLLGFEVTTIDQALRIADFFVSSNAVVTGTGTIQDTLEICLDQGCSAGNVLIGPTLLSGNGFAFPDTLLPGGPYNNIWVFDDLHAVVPTETIGAVEISRIDKVVTQTTPEPATLLLLGGALAGMGFVRRRKS